MHFEQIYNKYVDIVYSFLRQRLRDHYLIEDIIQNTFLALYNNLNKINEDSIKNWLLTVAHNKMVDHLRKNKNETLSINDNLAQKKLSKQFSDNNLMLNEMIKELDGSSRQIIYGLYVLELKYKELAFIMGIPEGTVKSKAYYARNKLRKELELNRG